jgi:hypothetical protein
MTNSVGPFDLHPTWRPDVSTARNPTGTFVRNQAEAAHHHGDCDRCRLEADTEPLVGIYQRERDRETRQAPLLR